MSGMNSSSSAATSKSLVASPTAIGPGSSHPPPAPPPCSIRSPFTTKHSSPLTSIRHPLGLHGRSLQIQAPGLSLQPPRNAPFIEMSSRKNPRIAHPPKTSTLALDTTHWQRLSGRANLRRLRHRQPFPLPAPCGPSRSSRPHCRPPRDLTFHVKTARTDNVSVARPVAP